SRSALERLRYSDAIEAARRGLDLAGHWPAFAAYRRALDDERALAQRDARAAELHRLVELVRLRHGIDPPAADEADALVARGRAIWQARESLARPVAARREPEVERTIRADLLDFALVWADLIVRRAPAGRSDEARR